MQCLIVLSISSRTTTGTETEHIVNVGSEERIDLINCNFPTWVSIDDMEVSCLLTMFIRGQTIPPLVLVTPLAG
jgi:hypothetical protein